MTQIDDSDRLIQEVLSELGWDEDPEEIANKVRRLDKGLPLEDEFTAICSWLGKTHLVHKLDQHQAPRSSRDHFQVPDLLVQFEHASPVLIEVKSKAKPQLSFKPDYLRRLYAYAQLLKLPLLFAWKYQSVWVLFEARHLCKAKSNFNINFQDAIKENLLGILAGDVAYALEPGAGIRFRCKKQKLISEGQSKDGCKISEWQLFIEEVGFMKTGGQPVDELEPEVSALFTTWDLSEQQTHSETHIEIHFVVADDEEIVFGHTALTHLLNWQLRKGDSINWRHTIRSDAIVSSVSNLQKALRVGREREVVRLVYNQEPQTWPSFLARP
ncbi:restriction endonuclease [Roseibium sp.]|uniref:restriction endonuclease n=1 Tax=Roseibium sp. TaxID=1936156 RepID=UPI003D10400B